MKKIGLMVLMVMVSLSTAFAQLNVTSSVNNGHRYVDLGLPSGTKWAAKNLPGLRSLSEALHHGWGNGWELPSERQFEELLEFCEFEWTSNGYKVTGPNGESIFLPAEGLQSYYGNSSVGLVGYYWTIEYGRESGTSMCFCFNRNKMEMNDQYNGDKISARLVLEK